MTTDRYHQRGVSSGKEDVHKAIAGLDKGIVPGAFCKILPDLVGGSADHAFIIHADGAGTKSALAWMYWKETGDLSVWEGIAQDALVMNTDDVACAGAVQDMVISSTIGRNKRLVPGEVIQALIQGTEKYLEMLRRHGIAIHSGGGETADLGDLVRTVIVDTTLACRMKRSDIIDNHQISPGLVVVSFASFGQAGYEETYNSGIGSNGLTGARHEIFSPDYQTSYPDTYEPGTPKDLVYCGPWKLTDSVPGHTLDMGKMVLSPTRTYLPLLSEILKHYRPRIKGIIHNSGGGQTKCLHFLRQVRVVKDQLPPAPFLFQEIKKCSGASWQEMYKTYNMGYRLEIYTDESTATELMALSATFNIDSCISGYTLPHPDKALDISDPEGNIWSY
jgi:phosphoribosylformylglycinamidine cyclo-ligase